MPPRSRRTVRDEPPPEMAKALAEARAYVVGIERWTLEQWHEAITRMRRLSAELRLGLHDPGEPNVIDLPYGPDLEGGVAQIGPVMVRVVERRPLPAIGTEYHGAVVVYPDAPDKFVAIQAAGHFIPREELPAIIISLEASDEHILAEVERVLRERGRFKNLPRTTGPYSLSRRLRSGHAGALWRKYRIVELVEMLAWMATSGCGYAEHHLGFWIDSAQLGTSRKTSEAKAVARRAIAALPEIMAEVEKVRLPC